MDKKLLAILCCPVSHRELRLAKAEELKSLNAAIAAGSVSNRDGVRLREPLTEALVTDDGKLLYPIDNGIPVLLEGEGIGLSQAVDA